MPFIRSAGLVAIFAPHAARDITSWSHYADGGYIGLWFVNAADALLDDFGGGNVTIAGRRPQNDSSFQLASYHPPALSLPKMPPLLPLPNLPLQQTASLTIDYTYDALHRLTSATYSDGRSFQYIYDPAGNVLELQQNLGPGTVTTTYSYNTTNELVTAQVDGTTWNYTYDANGSLTEVLPNGNPGTVQNVIPIMLQVTSYKWKRTMAQVGVRKLRWTITDSVSA